VAVKLVEELGEIAEKALDCFEGKDRDYSMAPFRLGPLFEAAHSTLRGLGFGDPRIDRLLNGGMELGALGGKQSGAGGGGAFFLVYPSSESARAAASALAELARREGLPLATPPHAYSPSR
jgi:mevalonate kinase